MTNKTKKMPQPSINQESTAGSEIPDLLQPTNNPAINKLQELIISPAKKRLAKSQQKNTDKLNGINYLVNCALKEKGSAVNINDDYAFTIPPYQLPHEVKGTPRKENIEKSHKRIQDLMWLYQNGDEIHKEIIVRNLLTQCAHHNLLRAKAGETVDSKHLLDSTSWMTVELKRSAGKFRENLKSLVKNRIEIPAMFGPMPETLKASQCFIEELGVFSENHANYQIDSHRAPEFGTDDSYAAYAYSLIQKIDEIRVSKVIYGAEKNAFNGSMIEENLRARIKSLKPFGPKTWLSWRKLAGALLSAQYGSLDDAISGSNPSSQLTTAFKSAAKIKRIKKR